MSLKRIISLTSIPPRFSKLPITLKSLRRQPADSVRLYIPRYYRRFPDWDGILPDVPPGVTVVRCETDYGPATKVLAACDEYADQDVQILFCDDDCIVAPDWAERLFSEQARRSGEAVATWVRSVEGYVDNRVQTLGGQRARKMSVTYDLPYRAMRLVGRILRKDLGWPRLIYRAGYGDIFFGVAGVVVRSRFFNRDRRPVPDTVIMQDDIWLSARLASEKIPIYCPSFNPFPKATESSAVSALIDTSVCGLSRQPLNRSVAQYCQRLYGIWQAI